MPKWVKPPTFPSRTSFKRSKYRANCAVSPRHETLKLLPDGAHTSAEGRLGEAMVPRILFSSVIVFARSLIDELKKEDEAISIYVVRGKTP